jgi:hypothetical protein
MHPFHSVDPGDTGNAFSFTCYVKPEFFLFFWGLYSMAFLVITLFMYLSFPEIRAYAFLDFFYKDGVYPLISNIF